MSRLRSLSTTWISCSGAQPSPQLFLFSLFLAGVTFLVGMTVGEAVLQADLDTWRKHYNEERVHSGKHCFGKMPMQTLLDSMPLVKEKTLNNNVQAEVA